ncbi:MAG: tetratricopeptide repeat protein, partial [bacterium]
SQYKKAISAFEKSLETGALPEGVQHNMLYNVSQLYAAIPDYKKAIGKYEEWFGLAESPNVDSYVYAATIYAQLKNYSKAIEKISKAISMSEKPKERWYQLLLAMYYQQKQYPEAAKTLETMVALFPDNPKYWKQLSGVYFTLKKHRKALVALELAHKRGFLENEKERMNLVNMYLFQDIPYKAAVLLDQELRDGNIPATGDNIEKLGEAWMAAKENDLAIENLLKAADAKSDGRLYLRVAQLLADQEDWPRVLTTIDKAQSTGTLPKPGKALLVKGMALYEQGKYQAAISQFQRGLKYPESKKQAGQWITHINNERELMER